MKNMGKLVHDHIVKQRQGSHNKSPVEPDIVTGCAAPPPTLGVPHRHPRITRPHALRPDIKSARKLLPRAALEPQKNFKTNRLAPAIELRIFVLIRPIHDKAMRSKRAALPLRGVVGNLKPQGKPKIRNDFALNKRPLRRDIKRRRRPQQRNLPRKPMFMASHKRLNRGKTHALRSRDLKPCGRFQHKRNAPLAPPGTLHPDIQARIPHQHSARLRIFVRIKSPHRC